MDEKTAAEKNFGPDTHVEDVRSQKRISANLNENVSAKLENPLEGIPRDQLLRDAEAFAKTHGLEEYTDEFKKGALVAQDPLGFESIDMLTEEDKMELRLERTHRWNQPKTLYGLVIMCSVAAAVQGVRHLLNVGAGPHLMIVSDG